MNRPVEHLSDAELEAFSRRTPAAAKLGEFDAHLSGCGECRRRLAEIAPVASLYAGIRTALQDTGEAHLAYEEVRNAAEGRPSVRAVGHLESCAACRAEVADLAQFSASLPAKPRGQPAPVNRMRRWAIAAMLLIALPLAWWIWRQAQPQYVAAVRDGGAWVGLDRNGRLHAPAGIPAEGAQALRQTLASRQLPLRTGYGAVQPEVLLGPPGQEASPSLTLVYPTGEAVLTGRPQFEWRVSGAAGPYRVHVYDRNFRLAMESPELHAETWTPVSELAAGQSYTWVVTAQAGGREIRAPIPPAAEARFEVLPQAQAAQLDTWRRQYPSEHLMLAALFAQAGALRHARQELQALEHANSGSGLVRQIAAALPGGESHQAPNSSKPAQ